jgi:hypothetical protein
MFPGLLLMRITPAFASRLRAAATLGPHHYSYVALRYAADFLAAISFPCSP